MEGFHYINMKGEVKNVLAKHAFDTNLQKQLDYFPCDEDGKPVSQVQPAKPYSFQEVKKNAPVAEGDVKVEIPAGSDIINPLDEASENEAVAQPVEKKKPGRKAAVKK